MKKSKLFFLILLAACLVLNGCSLALPETDADSAQQDEFVGIVLSPEYSNAEFCEGDEFPIEQLRKETEGRTLYLYSGTREDEAGQYRATASGGMLDVKSYFNVTDEAESIAVEGTIYATKNSSGIFRPYALYQRGDGSCYVGEGLNGMQSGFHAGSSMRMEQERSRNAANRDGENITESIKFTLSIVFIDQLQSARAVFLDERYEVVAEEALGKENITLAFPAEAELLLIEEIYLDENGESYVSRAVYQRGESETEYHILKWEGERGIVSASTVTITGLSRG